MFKSNKRITKNDVRKRLFKINRIIIIILFAAYIILFSTYFINEFREKIQLSNDNLVRQIANSYDFELGNVKNNIVKLLGYKSNIYESLENYDSSSYAKKQIIDNFDAILVENDIVTDVCIYIEKADEIAVVSDSYSSFYSGDSYEDKALLENPNDVLLSNFRLVSSAEKDKTIMNLCVRLPEMQGNILAVNVDMDEAYTMLIGHEWDKNSPILKINNKQDELIYPNSEQELADRLGRYESSTSYNSPDSGLKYTIYFSDIGLGIFPPAILILFIVMLGIAIIVMHISKRILNIYLKPIDRVIGEHSDNIFKNMVIGNTMPMKDVFEMFFGESEDIDNMKFCVLMANFELSDWSADMIKAVSFAINSEKYCSVLMLKDNEDVSELKKVISEAYSNISAADGMMSVSSIRSGYGNIPSLYVQAATAFSYRIWADTNIVYYSCLRFSDDKFEYQRENERRLINNLVTGSFESSKIYLDKLFNEIKECPNSIDDEHIRNIVYRLQSAILKCVASYPISIKAETEIDFAEETSLTGMYNVILRLVSDICDEINKKNENDKYRLYNVIMEYIEKNYTRSDISNTLISDELNLNKGYLSKIIKECCGESLPEYINKKRIELAKQLLAATDMPIEKIAGNVGYNYSYYFIKIFKSHENMTPGEYRKKCGK